MKDYTRLFDIIYYQNENKPLKAAIAAKETADTGKQWREYSTGECIEIINKVSNALLSLGIKKDDKIAIISNNRPEWNFLDLGMQQIGAVNVPVYPTITESEYEFIFNHAEVKLCFVSDQELFDKVSSIKNKVPSLQNIYTFDDIEGAKNWKTILTEVGEDGLRKIETYRNQVREEDMATIIYTSGTTGTPKGVMLSHKNLVSNIKSVSSVLPMDSIPKALSFLPLCHSFERTVYYVYLANCVSIYYAENLDTIGENLREVKPACFTTVPRLLEKVYEKIMEKGRSLTGIKKKLFFWALNLGLQYEVGKDLGWYYNFRLSIARKLIFSKWIEALGGNIKIIVTGAAAMQPRLGKLFTAAGITVIEGYGLTETSPVISTNRFEEQNRAIGTVGIPIPGVEVKIANDGEILARGPNIMMGYYKRKDLTDEAIDKDGWIHTGDIGEFINGKFLKITDRKKELFKTSGGKYIAPQPLENKYKEYPYIEQIMIVGENRKFVSALIVPSFPNLREWCAKKGLQNSTNKELIGHPEVISEFQNAIEQFNKGINKVEQVKKFQLLPDEWSVESGELTPTMKLKRRVILEKYKNDIEEIYSD